MKKSAKEIIDIMAQKFSMPDNIKLKDPELNFSYTNKIMFHEMIFKTIIDKLGLFYDEPTLYITGAHDTGKHSKNSLHYSGMALDIRTWNMSDKIFNAKYDTTLWQSALANAWVTVANELEDYYFIIHFDLSHPHIHLQYSNENIRKDSKGNLVGNWQGINKNLIIKPENNKITL